MLAVVLSAQISVDVLISCLLYTSVLTALDLSAGTVEAALKLKADLIVTHHPPIYTPISTITDDSPEGDLLLTLAEHNIALFSAHTNVDATVGEMCIRDSCGTARIWH